MGERRESEENEEGERGKERGRRGGGWEEGKAEFPVEDVCCHLLGRCLLDIPD